MESEGAGRASAQSNVGPTLLVTGAAGVLGSRLLQALAKTDHRFDRIFGIDRVAIQGCPHPKIECYQADLTSMVDFDSQVLEATHVVHLAADLTIPRYLRAGWPRLYDDNVRSVWNLYEHLPNLRHLVLASSYMVYRQDPVGNHLTEESLLGPMNPYAWTKCASELLVSEMSCSTATLRLAGVYGPGVPLTLDRVVPTVVRHVSSDEPLVLRGDGSAARNYLFIDDATRALFDASVNEWSGVYNIAGLETLSIREVVTLAENIVGRESVVRWSDDTEIGNRITLDVGWARRDRDFRPQVKMERGLSLYLAWAADRNDVHDP